MEVGDICQKKMWFVIWVKVAGWAMEKRALNQCLCCKRKTAGFWLSL